MARTRTLLVAASSLVALGAAPAATAAKPPRSVHLRGTAYEFNNGQTRLAGATIRVAELPRVRATARRDGRYDLVVPDRTRVTPYIEAAGHHTIYLQTFTTAGEDLENVNFQTPSDAAYNLLAGVLSVSLDANGNPSRCAIVSTFSTRNVRDLSFAGFLAYGAHGVAGATATATPSLPDPIYFNESVIPDRSQRASSKDGGVVWTEVPTGVYAIAARQPTTRFAGFVATCRPGRIVNANPPWGLHELAPASPARLSATWGVTGSGPALRALTARRLPGRAEVRVRCTGPRCPFATRTLRATGSTLDVAGRLGAAATRLRPGQTLEVGVFAHGFDGRVVRWAIRANRTPRPQTLCVPLGSTRPRRVC